MKKARRIPFSFRTSAKLRAAVEAAARRSGRSLAQELEYRIEVSFLAERWGVRPATKSMEEGER